ncbi:MAG TPA: hypothetical protein VIL86_08000 [Tepidisphaeraceae bacterium]|jgi:hypothetical protein
MQVSRLACVVVLAGLMVGCRHNPPPQKEMPAAVSSQTLQSIRESYRQLDPNARVGQVLAVEPSADLAAVGEVDVKDFKEGDSITFLDASQNLIANGTVVRIVTGEGGDWLHVRYEPAARGGRAPAVGDLAVRVK